jgi:adenylosuccinate lyase
MTPPTAAFPSPSLPIDVALLLVVNVARGLVVYPSTIQSAVMAELPSAATEEILMAPCGRAATTQLHELIQAGIYSLRPSK